MWGGSLQIHLISRVSWGRAQDAIPALTAYPPGSCAAQSALILLRDDGGVPAAMTEQLFSSLDAERGVPTKTPIRYIDNRNGQMEVTERGFAPGETVPPCGSCELLVPLLLCADDEAVCSHGGTAQ